MYKPVKITDVTLRDGQEDFVLKYLPVAELTRLVGLLDRVGFYSLDGWGGTTFYAALTGMQEDPWERLRALRRALSHTPLQMIIRGRMLVGFKPYHQEVVRRFVNRAAQLGVDIFRVYDTLNDVDNLTGPIMVAKELRKQVEATVLISANPEVTQEDYLLMINRLSQLGADVLCINDSFGVLTPHQVKSLVSACKRYFYQPIRLHVHDNRQAAVSCYQEGVRQGAELVDTTLGTLSWPYGPPPLESLAFSLGGTSYDPHVDLDVLAEASEYVDYLKEKYRYREPAVKKVEDGLIPGPLKEFIREELIRREARDRQSQAFKEGQQVWADLGYPALKGRLLEIVGLQAVANVLDGGRYQHLIPPMLDLLRGKYGRLHVPVLPDLLHRALTGLEFPEEKGIEKEGRLLSRPDLQNEDDLITYSLFPEEAEVFFLGRGRGGGVRPTPMVPPAAPEPSLAPAATRQLTLVYKGDEVAARLEGVGDTPKGPKRLFIKIHDQVEAVEVEPVAEPEEEPYYLVTFHGDTYRLKLSRTFSREQEFTAVLVEINGKLEEFLIR